MRRTSGYCEANSEYGYSRMTMELKEGALDVRERRVGWPMHTDGIEAIRMRRHKVTMNSYDI